MTQKELNILFVDLAYTSNLDYVIPIPLNIACLASYLKERFPDISFHLLNDPIELYNTIEGNLNKYQIIAMTNYDWNQNLNKKFLKLIKENHPESLVVMGGPNVDASTEEGLQELFNNLPGVDLYIIGEGEERFTRLVSNLIENDLEVAGVWEMLPPTIIGRDKATKSIIKGAGEEVPLCDLAKMPSPYQMGLLDRFLEDPNLVPILEMTRGCPYTCAFCSWGKYSGSILRKFPLDRIVNDIEYITKKNKNPMKSLYITDGNFGIFDRDVKIAEILRKGKEKNGFPESVYVYLSKTVDEKLLKITGLLKDMIYVGMSKQTMNPDVLKIIGRHNIPDVQYGMFRDKLKEIGVDPYCELIYGLPGESIESFLDGLEKISEFDVKVGLYPLFLFKGTDVNSREFRGKYGMKSAFRVIPRYTGSYAGVNSVEYEEILLSNNNFSEEDYFTVRQFHFFYSMFFEDLFQELFRFIDENALNRFSFIRFLVNDHPNWPVSLKKVLEEFKAAAKKELLSKEQLKFDHTVDEIEEVRSECLALNVFYFLKILSKADDTATLKLYFFDAVKEYFVSNGVTVSKEELSCVLDFCFDKVPAFPKIEPEMMKEYYYDVELWLKSDSAAHFLSEYKVRVPIKYHFKYDPKLCGLFKEQTKKYGDSALGLYHFRMNFVANRYLAYSYRRTRSN